MATAERNLFEVLEDCRQSQGFRFEQCLLTVLRVLQDNVDVYMILGEEDHLPWQQVQDHLPS